MPDGVVAAVIAMRHRLEAEGKDSGPLSILDVLWRDGFPILVSRSTIARILDREHLVTRNRRKRPKGSYGSIRSQYPNQRWQSDGVEITLGNGQTVVVIEIIDDCTRYRLGLHPGVGETSDVVVEAFRIAIKQHGVPVLVHTDNGTAFNQDRYGGFNALQAMLGDLGVRMITGRPATPRSQGKVERSHQTLQKFISARNPYDIAALSGVLDEYRHWFNYERSHQALPPRTAPGDLYDTMPKMAPPPIQPSPRRPRTPARPHELAPVTQRTARRHGKIRFHGYVFLLGNAWEGHDITLVANDHALELFDANGTWLTTTPWPPERPTTGLGRRITTDPPTNEVSNMS